jgi:molybdate transport system regulatory protein
MKEMDVRKWELRSKVWLEWDGRPIMGEGRMAMLQAIDRCGSIIEASRETGISYRKIRGAIREMEDILRRPVVRAHRGGERGGGATLTPAARDLLDFFRRLSGGFRQDMDAKFREQSEIF